MKLAGVDIRDFKSFGNAAVTLGRFNVIIGPNAAGKSNFVDIFSFLTDCAREGFANAVSLQGGGEYVRNLRAAPAETTEIAVSLDAGAAPIRVRFFRDGGRVVEAVVGSCTYSLSLHCTAAACTIASEEIAAACTYPAGGRTDFSVWQGAGIARQIHRLQIGRARVRSP